MPSISIDTFFACTLMVAVVIISTVMSTGILTTQINSLQNTNQQAYFQAIAQYILSNPGTPTDWGSNPATIPDNFGLAANNSLYPNQLDIDKVSRLNAQNAFGLTYPEVFNATALKSAFAISISQIIDVAIHPTSNFTSNNATTYTFTIQTAEDGVPAQTSLHYYVIAQNFTYNALNNTASDGTASINFEIPDSSAGTAALIVFARTDSDPRVTSYGIYSFGHLSPDPESNGTYVNISPLNYTLSTILNNSDTNPDTYYALSYAYSYNLAPTSNTTCRIPRSLDNSPIVLIASGRSNSTYFIEWTSYPQIPLKIGADLKNSESYAFSYIVTIKNTLYRATLSFGGTNQ